MALTLLREYRQKSVRAPREVLEKGRLLLETKSPRSFGDELYPLLEQTYLAALDCGDFSLASQLYDQLDQRFPNSPRVEVLMGMRLEAEGDLDVARRLYEDILFADESNIIAWKRLVAVLKQQRQITKAIEQLGQMLDTVYNDLEGWLELAALYTDVYQYDHALSSLSHALLLAPQNPFHHLLFAETAYTASDIPLALRYFLRTTELVDSPSPEEAGAAGTVELRAWMGVKQCIRRIQYSPRQVESKSNTPLPEKAGMLDELATERILEAYKAGKGGKEVPGRREVVRWLEGTS